MPFIWTDGTWLSEEQFPESGLHSPVHHTVCTESNQCEKMNSSATSFLHTNRNGQCAAGKKLAGVQDFSINYVDCDTYQHVAVFCEHQQTENNLEQFSFHNNLSDVTVSTSASGFYKFLYSPDHPACPENWIRFDNKCIQLFNYTCAAGRFSRFCIINLHKLCPSGTLFKPFIVPEDVVRSQDLQSVGLHTIKHNRMGNYRALFQLLGNLRIERFSQQQVSIVADLNNKCERTERVCVIEFGRKRLSSPFNFISRGTHPILCEVDPLKNNSTSSQSSCADTYMTCVDGTCIHPSLVCDGHQHCVDGKDEKNCSNVCSDPDINCYKDCHVMNLCSCSPGYFQCLSGGCISLHL